MSALWRIDSRRAGRPPADRLPLEQQTEATNAKIAALLAAILSGRGFEHADLATRDVAALSRGMIDAAGLAGETDRAALVDRLHPAVVGYLANGA